LTTARREFIKRIGRVVVTLGAAPVVARSLQRTAAAAEFAQSRAVRAGRAQRLTILHTADIHAQLDIHDEFFWEQGKTGIQAAWGICDAANDDQRAAAAEPRQHAAC
jgi:2',3'-cyclic-nucleotide 2'-phosphodiesterase (5'-nucleotidase family)